MSDSNSKQKEMAEMDSDSCSATILFPIAKKRTIEGSSTGRQAVEGSSIAGPSNGSTDVPSSSGMHWHYAA